MKNERVKVMEMKKGLYSVGMAVILASMLSVSASAQENNLLFSMNFDDCSTVAEVGKAELVGSVTYEKSDNGTYAARFSGTGNYLALTNSDGSSLLKGKDEITISFRKKADNATSWWFYAAPNTNTQTYQKEHYIGILDNGSKLLAERYNNNGARNESSEYSYTAGAWQEVVLVIGKDKSILYVDGNAVSEREYGFKISEMLGSTPITYIGKANWSSGEWASGVIDDIEIYSVAPDVEIGNLTNVREDLVLPTATIENDGYGIVWESSDEQTISADGKVTMPEIGKKDVELTATIIFGMHTITKKFNAVVRAEERIKNIITENGVVKSAEISLPENVSKARLYAVKYTEDKKMSNVQVFDVTESTTVDINCGLSDGFVRLMLWDENNRALSLVKTVDISGTTDMEEVRIASYLDDRGKVVSLAPRGGVHSENQPIVVWEYDSFEHHTWLGKSVDKNTYRFISKTGTSEMAIAASGNNVGDEIVLKPESETDEYQIWIAEDEGNGYVRLKNKASGMYLTCMRTTNYSMYKDDIILKNTVSADRKTNVTMANCVLLPYGENCDESQMWKFDYPVE